MRNKASELARWLNHLELPVFLLDEQRELVFANDATLKWFGCDRTSLPNLRCDFVSSDAEQPLAALCPPPEVFHGERVVVERVAHGAGGGQSSRHWEYLPLLAEGGCVGVLGIGHATCPPLAGPPSEAVRLHEQLQQQRRDWRKQYTLGRFVGESPAARRMRAQIVMAAGSCGNVLIEGPVGSGRRTLARTIQAISDPAAESLLIPFEAATLTAETLLDQVQATLARSPLRDVSKLPTLLLQGVDDLPLETQRALLTLATETPLRVRLIATATPALGERVAAGDFLADLAVALATLTIGIPRLAERKSDLPLLVQALVEEHNAAGGKQLSGFSTAALDALHAHSWPGEMTELTQFVAECQRRADGPYIGVSDLPPRVAHAAQATARPKRGLEAVDLESHLAQIERELIEAALVHAKQNKTKAAKQLGLTRPRLYRRMIQLGLAQPGSDEIEMEEQE